MNLKGTLTARKIAVLVKQGEGPSLEFKRSSGEMKEAMQILCAFLNGADGTVLFGVRSNGTIEGQDVTDQTQRDIAQASDRFEPAAHLAIRRVPLASGKEVVAITVNAGASVEVWSAGQFPTGITPAMLSREHDSVQRNPIIAAAMGKATLEKSS